MSTPRILKWVSAGLEAFFGIPLLGGAIIVRFLWTPLVLMLILHVFTLILSRREGYDSGGSILGIVTSCIGWIPIVGMIMHLISAVFIILDAEAAGRIEKGYYR